MRKTGFTLLEIMFVVATISVLASIAVPSALRSILQARESQALGIVRQYHVAQTQFITSEGHYGGIDDLTSMSKNDGMPYLGISVDTTYSSGSGSGYSIDLWINYGYQFLTYTRPESRYSAARYSIWIFPQALDRRSFFSDDSGAIRVAPAGQIANLYSPLLGEK